MPAAAEIPERSLQRLLADPPRSRARELFDAGGRMRILAIALVAAIAGWPHDAVAQSLEEMERTCATGRPMEARIDVCDRLLRDAPEDTRILHHKAAALAHVGNVVDALAVWQTVVRLKPDDFAGHHNAGLMLELLGHFPEALTHFDLARTLTSDPSLLHSTYWHLGAVQYNLKTYDAALASFREAARLDPADVTSWSYAAVVAALLNHHAEAVSHWERALRLDPQYFGKAQSGERLLYEKSVLLARKEASRNPRDNE